MNKILLQSIYFLMIIVFISPSGMSTLIAQNNVTIPWTTTNKFYSEAVKDTFLISVALPENYDSTKEYPIVYLTDPRFGFGTAVEASRALAIEETIPPIILVGIGYPGDQGFGRIMQLRSRDYSTVSDPQVPGGWPAWADEIDWGGADAFLEFIKVELIPEIEQKYRTTGDRTYMGWSGGGHFGIYTLFNDPELFDNYLLVSAPLEWFHNSIAFDYEEKYATSHDSLPAQVLFMVGTEESHSTIESNKRMARILKDREHEGLDVSINVVQDKNHYGVWPISINHGLQQLLSKSN